MEWRKTIFHDRTLPLLSFLVLIIIVSGFIFISPLFFFIGLLYGLLLLANHFYDKQAGKSLSVVNVRTQKRMFIGDKGKLELHFKNTGIPILKGELKIYFNEKIGPDKEVEQLEEKHEPIKIPFSIGLREELSLKIPFAAKKRGVGRVRKIILSFPNLFGFSDITLEYTAFWKTEILIYPELTPIDLLPLEYQWKEGSISKRNSFFVDTLKLAGVREYKTGDSFHQIHWKATAKTGSLQTKQFEKVAESSLLILFNVADGFWWTANLEQIISHIAYIARKAYENNIPISIAVNLLSHGSFTYQYLAPGEGRSHFAKIMELLAVIDTHQRILPFKKVLTHISGTDWDSSLVLIAGKLSEGEKSLLFTRKKRGNSIFQLLVGETDSTIVKII